MTGPIFAQSSIVSTFNADCLFLVSAIMRRFVFQSGRAGTLASWIFCFGGAGMLAATLVANAAPVSPVRFAPPDGWVKPQMFRQPSTTLPVESGADQHWLLLERQINAPQNRTFVHVARQILTTAGVQNDATLTLDFNPGYQLLTFHWVRVWRGSEHFDRLDTNAVKVVQPERELDESVLNGQESVILVLNDIRVGDIIDYAYSIQGMNPVFGGHFSCAVPVRVDQPVDRLRTRLIWSRSRPLYARAHGCTVQPVLVTGTNDLEYIWDLKQAPGAPREDSLPTWCDPESWVQLSDFKTWAEVNQWAAALFQVTAPLSPELTARIADWRRITDREQQILAVLRFVQDDVRYFGIEIGASTQTPADPSTVFARRFGDCKDKSLLFVTILRALGIEANPVLVNATLGRGIADWQPAAGAFDHCIAQAGWGGRTYWLDPTINYQRGPLAAHYLPDYERGLVIAPRTTDLAVIPPAAGWSQTRTTEYFQLRGKTEPADLKVVTVAEGRDADALRELFAATRRGDLERSYTHFYSDLYPGIRMTSPLVLEDDAARNQIQTTEFYSIDRMWTQSDKDLKYRCEFYPATIAGLLKKPVDTDRQLPLGLAFPRHEILRTEVILPESWTPDTDRKLIDDPAFTFRKDCRCAGNRMVMEYEYQSLADSVPPTQVAGYLQHLNQSARALGYTLIWR